MGIFDFGERENTEKIIRETWDDFRNTLARGELSYDEIDRAKEQVFLHQLDDYFEQHDGKRYFTKELGQVVQSEFYLARGTVLKVDEAVNYDRFMPISQYIKDDNRFSPPCVEWLYLACGHTGSAEQRNRNAEQCTLFECKAKEGDRFGICHFIINSAYYNAKVVDLTIASDLTFEAINDELEQYGRRVQKKAAKVFRSIGLIPYTDKKALEEVLTKWFAYTDAKLISEQLFLPVAEGEKKYMYAPFQCLAKYFESLGYVGIIFKSTVYPYAKNLVLFDKGMATAVGDIKDFIVTDEEVQLND